MSQIQQILSLFALAAQPGPTQEMVLDTAIAQLYDYLQNPDTQDIAMAQSVLISALSNPEVKEKMKAQAGGMTKEQFAIAVEKADLNLEGNVALGTMIVNSSTSRQTSVRENLLGAGATESLLKQQAERMHFAQEKGLTADLVWSTTQSQQNARGAMIDGLQSVISFQQITGFMSELAQRLDRQDFKTAFLTVTPLITQIQTEIAEASEAALDKIIEIEMDPNATKADLEAAMLEAGAKNSTIIQGILHDAIKGVPSHNATLQNILQALEDSAIASGLIKEADYNDFLTKVTEASLAATADFDQQYGFTPSAATAKAAAPKGPKR